MYSEQQGNYFSMMHLTASSVSIPKSVSGNDLVMVNSMIEAMAYHAMDTLTEQYYKVKAHQEQLLKENGKLTGFTGIE